MKKSIALKAIETLPSFSVIDAKELGVSAANPGYYVSKGRIRRLGRGIYQSTDYKGSIENFRWEDLIESVNSVRCL